MKLTLDEKQALYDMTDTAGWEVMVKILEELVAGQELDVLKYDIKTKDKDGLLYVKCEATGSRKLLVSLQSFVKSLRVAASNADERT